MCKSSTGNSHLALKLIILFVLFAILQIMIQVSGRIPGLSTYNGVLTSFQYGTCLLMLLVDRKLGTRFSIILLGISALTMIMVISRGNVHAVPGLCNTLFYIVTIIILATYDARREIENKTDFVTGVFNRKGLYLELQTMINRKHPFDILYISLNNFKDINDSYGHAYGDELLCKVSKRIRIKCGNDCIISRVGGAEFVVAFREKEDIVSVANQLLDIIREKTILVVDDNRVDCYIEGFAGISRYPQDASDAESLIKYADIAMTEAVGKRIKTACEFDISMLESISKQIQIKNIIKEGFGRHSFYLMYQPQYDIKTKKLRGFEALIRMTGPNGSIVSPGEFIPVAEKSELILQIDDYVIGKAMRDFRDVVHENPELIISINVSAKNFADSGFVEKVQRSLEKTRFPGNNFEIEITEYCMVNSMSTTTENILALKELGVHIALDDFGTGYTALSYVSTLPFDLLKIDKSLIDDIENDQKKRDFVKAVITMGQLMACDVISEGVENDNQIDCLKLAGCDYVQGFVWGRPLMLEDAKALITNK